MQALLGLCCKGKLDGDSFVQYLVSAKTHFQHLSLETPHDEFGQSLIEAIWIKQAELPHADTLLQESFRNTMKPILPQLI